MTQRKHKVPRQALSALAHCIVTTVILIRNYNARVKLYSECSWLLLYLNITSIIYVDGCIISVWWKGKLFENKHFVLFYKLLAWNNLSYQSDISITSEIPGITDYVCYLSFIPTNFNFLLHALSQKLLFFRAKLKCYKFLSLRFWGFWRSVW